MNYIKAYLKKKLVKREMNIKYNHGHEYGIDDTIFNFTAEPAKHPYGDVIFTTSYDNDPDYTSTFFMTAEEAMKLGKLLINTAMDSMESKQILQEADLCDGRLSLMVLKRLIDKITIERSNEKLENYEKPYYNYIITAFKDNTPVYGYQVVLNLSYFRSEKEIKYWKDRLTDKETVHLELINWNPYKELEARKLLYQDKLNKELEKINIKPKKIEK